MRQRSLPRAKEKQMARRARIVIPGIPHHLTQRGVRRNPIFFDKADRQLYYRLLFKMCKLHGVHVHSYSWMPNHVHIVAIPDRADSFAKTFRPVNSTYALLHNEKYGTSGYLWEDRFFSCALDEYHYRAAVRYVERNAVRAGLVDRAEDYPWSSARSHCGLEADELVEPALDVLSDIQDWAAWLAGDTDAKVEQAIRKSTSSGWPCGSEEFVRECESTTGRILMPQRSTARKRILGKEIRQLYLPED